MSFVQTTPEFVAAAATDLARIGSTITSANTAALGPTSGVLAPGADEVSASIAALFDAHSQVYQALSAQAAAFHSQFVQLMNGGAMQYAVTEAANATPLQTAAAPASMAAQVPTMTAGAMGASAPTAPAGPLAAAVTAAAAAAAPAPAGTPVAAAPAGATLASATAPAGPARVAPPAYTPAGSPATVQPTASAPPTSAAAPMQAEVAPQASPATTLPVSPRTAPHSPTASQSAAPPVRRIPIMPPDPPA
ncbi:PE family protein [Mycobacterium sp. 852002-10029_SCH5224772]|uniref:PE family protein n=1 Tax=Mycobacterium sp. 852002-10029_SCH5224772 TaxID=1834083 RepID=UPI000AB3430E|nr:PE family protein [Mycobacterium sp. 852002-10029_SCH5224772]